MWRGISCRLCHQKEVEKPIHAFTIIRLAVLDGCHGLWICINPIMSLSEFLPLRSASFPMCSQCIILPIIHLLLLPLCCIKGREMFPKCICIGMEQLSIRHHEYSFMTDFCFTAASLLCWDFPVFTVNTRLWLHVQSQTVHVNIITASNRKIAFFFLDQYKTKTLFSLHTYSKSQRIKCNHEKFLLSGQQCISWSLCTGLHVRLCK